jgi:hypothetical protein
MEGKRFESDKGYAWILISADDIDPTIFRVFGSLNRDFKEEISQEEKDTELKGLLVRLIKLENCDGFNIKQIKAIYLGEMELNVSHLTLLALILIKYGWLEEIDLQHSAFGRIGCTKEGRDFLGVLSEHPTLKSFCAIDCYDCFDIADIFNLLKGHPTLETLELGWSMTAFRQKEIDALGNLLVFNRTLKTIDLACRETGELEFSALETLDCDYLLEYLAFNKTVTRLSLPDGLNIDLTKVAKILEQNNGEHCSLLHSVTSPIIESGLYDLESSSTSGVEDPTDESPTKKLRNR